MNTASSTEDEVRRGERGRGEMGEGRGERERGRGEMGEGENTS